MRCLTLHPSDLGRTEPDRWTELLAAHPGPRNPFLSAEFACAVGRVRPAARVAVIEDAGEVVGFFAHERHGRVARPIGSGLADCEGLVLAPGRTVRVPELLRRCGLAGWDFECLLDGQLPLEAYRTRVELSPVIELPDGSEQYRKVLRNRSARWFASTLRKQRKLEREVGELRFVFDARDDEALTALASWKSAQYARLGEWDRFADPGVVALVRDLLEASTPGCSGALSVLYAGNRPVAAHIGLWSRSVLSWWFPGYDPEFSRYSPGILLLLHLADAAAERGVELLDLGRGRHEYKETMKTGDLVVHAGSVDGALLPSVPRRARRVLRAGLGPLVRRLNR